jgi:hypothetical protein
MRNDEIVELKDNVVSYLECYNKDWRSFPASKLQKDTLFYTLKSVELLCEIALRLESK